MKNLIKAICEAEGKKHQASVGDVRQILKILADTLVDMQNPNGDEFLEYVSKRATKKHKIDTTVHLSMAQEQFVHKSDILFKKRKPKKK